MVPVGGGVAVVPREVGLHLRGGAIHRDSAFVPPELVCSDQDVRLVDRTGAGAAATLVDHVDRMLASWAAEPPQALRTGGLSVRAVGQVATLLGVEPADAALVAEVAFASGLIGTSDSAYPVWLPSVEFDRWRARSVADRWVVLVRGWLVTTRVPGLTGTRDERDKRIAPLGPEADRAAAPAIRADLLGVLAGLPAGSAPTRESLHRVVDWQAPRRGGHLHDDLIAWTVRELPSLGVTGIGALTSFAAGLVPGSTVDPGAVLASDLPEPVDHVLIQADLTAVAPGPLVASVAEAIGSVAQVESTGGATVYRFTEASIQRAFDAGGGADEVHRLLERVSRTPVPQPLTYLVDEVARRHGRVRVSAVGSVLRLDDPAIGDLLLSDPTLGALGLRRLSPTILAAKRSTQSVVDALRDSGHAAVAEGVDGELLVRQPSNQRAPAYRTARRLGGPPASPAALDALVRSLRAGERARASRPGQGDPNRPRLQHRTAVETVTLLTETAANAQTVWIGYVDNNGGASERLVDPLRVQGGWLTAYDHVRDAVRTFAVHRITGVAPLDAPRPAAVPGTADTE